MVVLDSNYGMLSNTTNENHYIIPDPATHPPSLDAKNSPLALLAQTCSLIGADSSNVKPLPSSMERAAKKPSSTSSNSSCASSTDRSSSANQQQQLPPQPVRYKSPTAAAAPETKSPESRLAFKPYEPIVLTRKSPPSSGGHHHTTEAYEERKSSSSRASSRKSASASPPSINTTTVSPRDSSAAKLSTSPTAATSATDSSKPQTPLEASTPTPSRTSSAVDAHYASLKDPAASFKSPFSLSPLAGYNCNGCPVPGLDPTNPAFRSPYGTSSVAHLPHPHAALLDAAAAFQSSSTPSPYLSYTRVKTPNGSEAVMPICKDPYCFSCRFTLHGVGPCPPGCVQCEPKYNAAAAAMLMSHPFAGYQYGRPYQCNWVGVGGNEYCGKRFRSSDELLQHLRSHTSTADPVALMNHLSRYPAGSVNPLAAARYHPYSKAAGLPASLAGSPFSAFNPALAPYYAPYPFYDQRIGAAVNP